jgi:hypothetical protein
MTSHERDLILKVADEVRTADPATVDPEAERLIRAEVGAQPHAAYLLTQRVIVQDLALQQAQSRIDELEARLRRAGLPAGGTSGAAPGGAPNQAEPPPSGRSGVGDFLRTAAAAAAGTIGGQLIYDGLRNWAAEQGGGGLLGGLAGSGFGGRRATDFDTDRTRVDDTNTEERDEGGGGDFGSEPADEDGSGAGGDWGDDQDADTDDGANQGDGSGGDW